MSHGRYENFLELRESYDRKVGRLQLGNLGLEASLRGGGYEDAGADRPDPFRALPENCRKPSLAPDGINQAAMSDTLEDVHDPANGYASGLSNRET